MNFKVLIFLASCIGCCYSSCIQNEGPTCTKLFEKPNLKGRVVNIPCGSVVSNLNNQCGQSNIVWDQTQSYAVEKGCSVYACSEPDFGGSCVTITGPNASEVQPALTNIMSINCTCPRSCPNDIPNEGSCHAVLQAMHNDIQRREAKYHELLEKVMSKEGDARVAACNAAKQEYNRTFAPCQTKKQPFRLRGKASNFCALQKGNTQRTGDPFVLWDCSENNWNQRHELYTAVYDDEKNETEVFFKLRCEHSGLCLTSPPTGGEVTQEPCSNSRYQYFRRKQSTTPGYPSFVNRGNGRCISSSVNSVSRDTKILTEPCEKGVTRFQWKQEFKP